MPVKNVSSMSSESSTGTSTSAYGLCWSIWIRPMSSTPTLPSDVASVRSSRIRCAR